MVFNTSCVRGYKVSCLVAVFSLSIFLLSFENVFSESWCSAQQCQIKGCIAGTVCADDNACQLSNGCTQCACAATCTININPFTPVSVAMTATGDRDGYSVWSCRDQNGTVVDYGSFVYSGTEVVSYDPETTTFLTCTASSDGLYNLASCSDTSSSVYGNTYSNYGNTYANTYAN